MAFIHEFLLRGQDRGGAGHFGASRGGGTRKHRGIDLLADENTIIQSHINGKVTRIGYPYRQLNRRHIRHVEITDSFSYKHRFFYVTPHLPKNKEFNSSLERQVVKVGDNVKVGDALGVVQSLEDLMKNVPVHVHYEIKKNGKHIDPTPVYTAQRDFINS